MRRVRRRSAVAIYLYCFGAVALFGLIGLAVDVSNAYHEKSKLQAAADAAALAGSLAQPNGTHVAEVEKFLGYNNVAMSELEALNILPANASDGPGIEVILRRDVETFFLRVLGKFTLPVAAKAAARNSSTSTDGACTTTGSCFGYSVYVTKLLIWNANDTDVSHSIAVGQPSAGTGDFIIGEANGNRGVNNDFHGDIHVVNDFHNDGNHNVVYGTLQLGGDFTQPSIAHPIDIRGGMGTDPEVPEPPGVPKDQIKADADTANTEFFYDAAQNRWEDENGNVITAATKPSWLSFSGNKAIIDQDNVNINGNYYFGTHPEGGTAGIVEIDNFDDGYGEANILSEGKIHFTKSNQQMHPDGVWNFISNSTADDAIFFVGNSNTTNGVMHAIDGGIIHDANTNIINGAMVAGRMEITNDANNLAIGSNCDNTAILDGTKTVCYHVHLVE